MLGRTIGIPLIVVGLGLMVLQVISLKVQYQREAAAQRLLDEHATTIGFAAWIGQHALPALDPTTLRPTRGPSQNICQYLYEVNGTFYAREEPVTLLPEDPVVTVHYLPSDPAVATIQLDDFLIRHSAHIGREWTSIVLLTATIILGCYLALRRPRPAKGRSRRSDRLPD